MQLNDWQPRRSGIGLTPLIDVVFLLLIFFMLASTFLKFSAVPLSGARGGGSAGTIKELALVQVRAADDLSVNGTPVTLAGFAAHIDRLLASGVTRAVIQPANEATVQDLVRVLEIAKTTRLQSVVVVR